MPSNLQVTAGIVHFKPVYPEDSFVLLRTSRNISLMQGIARTERDGTRAETRFRLSPKRTSPFKSVGGRQFSRMLAAELCASA